MDRRKFLSAYVRTNKRGKIATGSLALLKNRPKTSGFKQVVDPGVNSCYCPSGACGGPYWISQYNLSANGSWTIGESIYYPYIQDYAATYTDRDCNTVQIFRVRYNFIVEESQNVQDGYVLTKTSKEGVLMWQQLFYFFNIDSYIVGLQTDSKGDIYVAHEVGLIKFSKNGTLLWDTLFNTSNTDNPDKLQSIESFSLAKDIPVVTGLMYFDNESQYRTLIATISPTTGLVTKSKAYNVPLDNPTYSNNYGCYVMHGDPDGNIYGQCITSSPDYATSLFKLDLDLNMQWSKVTDLTLSTWYDDLDSPDITTDAEGNIYMNGYGAEFYKLNKDGNTVWTKMLVYYGGEETNLFSNPVTTDGKVFRTSDGWKGWFSFLNTGDSEFGVYWNGTPSEQSLIWTKGYTISQDVFNIGGYIYATYPVGGLRKTGWYGKFPTNNPVAPLTVGDFNFVDESVECSTSNTYNIVMTDITLDVADVQINYKPSAIVFGPPNLIDSLTILALP